MSVRLDKYRGGQNNQNLPKTVLLKTFKDK